MHTASDGSCSKYETEAFHRDFGKNGARMGIRTPHLHPSSIDHRKPLDCIRLSNIAWYS